MEQLTNLLNLLMKMAEGIMDFIRSIMNVIVPTGVFAQLQAGFLSLISAFGIMGTILIFVIMLFLGKMTAKVLKTAIMVIIIAVLMCVIGFLI